LQDVGIADGCNCLRCIAGEVFLERDRIPGLTLMNMDDIHLFFPFWALLFDTCYFGIDIKPVFRQHFNNKIMFQHFFWAVK